MKNQAASARSAALRPSLSSFDSRGAAAAGSVADRAMERYALGDDAAFAVVYDALAERLLAFLRSKLGSLPRAEDLVQQTFLRMHRARGTFVSGSAVLPWAFAIARRLLIDELRRSRRHALRGEQVVSDEVTQPSPDPSAQALLEADDLARRLQDRLSALPASQREAFELTRLQGLSHLEAAQVLGMTVQAVKLRTHRASVALRGVLGG